MLAGGPAKTSRSILLAVLPVLLAVTVCGCATSHPKHQAEPRPQRRSPPVEELRGDAADENRATVRGVNFESEDSDDDNKAEDTEAEFVELADVNWDRPDGTAKAEPVEPGVAPTEPDAEPAEFAEEILAASDPSAAVVPIDLPTALAVATGNNPQVAFAQARIREAEAELDNAEVLWLPSLRTGLNYHTRDGTIQNTEGRILDSRRTGYFAGLGARAVGGGSVGVPGVWANFHLADAVFQPRIAGHVSGARRHAARATLNDTLLQVATEYLQVLRALQALSIAQETVDHMTELAETTETFADAGMIPQADVDRVFAEVAVRRNTVRQAQEGLRVASSHMVRTLSGDAGTTLIPADPGVVPLELVSLDDDVSAMIQIGLMRRPELAENRASVAEAVEQFRRQRFAPLVPSVALGMTYGGLGGGAGNDLDEFGDRVDFDAAAWWEVRQLGLGERANRRATRSRTKQSRLRQVQLMDQVAQQVNEAATQVRFRREQIPIAKEGVRRAVDSHRRNRQRIRQGEGLPLEALQSVGALDRARREYLRAVTEFNEAQFKLQHALGWPIDSPGPIDPPGR